MLEYQVQVDQNTGDFIINGSFEEDSIPISIPKSDPDRKRFIDLFLHKADIERGIDFLKCISLDKTDIMNEGLFIAGLNNCIKCFKKSKSRCKMDKITVFANNDQLLKSFMEFEEMRDKHFDHDESGMLQAIAFLLISNGDEHVFGGPPSVVWNRAPLNYYFIGQKLQEVMQYIWKYLCKEIDEAGALILTRYKEITKEELLKLEAPEIVTASKSSQRML